MANAKPKPAELVNTPAPEDKQIAQARSSAVLARDKCLSLAVITKPEEFELAGELLKECANARSVVAAHMDPLCDAAHKSWKATTEKRKEMLAPVDAAESHLRNIRSAYQRKIAEDNRRAQEEAARKQREAEEAQRIAYEKQQKAAAKKGVAPPPAPEPIPVPVVEPVYQSAPQTSGVSMVKVWKFEIVDFPALVKAVAEGKADIHNLLPNEKLIGANVKVLKGGYSLPGVRVFEDFQDRVNKG